MASGVISIVGDVRSITEPWYRFQGVVGAFEVPCGKCQGCRVRRTEEWGMRCLHEAKMWRENCFVTLTYRDEEVPPTLDHKDFQVFIRSLRKRIAGTIRFFMCGEYGDQLGRPHFHACLFNYRPSDGKFHSCKDGQRLYKSEFLDKVWGKGFTYFGEVTYASAAYVAGYICKYIDGEMAKDLPEGFVQEYGSMSRKPGIGAKFVHKYLEDIYAFDQCVLDAMGHKPPRFYDKLLKRIDPVRFEELKELREEESVKRKDRFDRWDAKEVILRNRIARKIRSL